GLGGVAGVLALLRAIDAVGDLRRALPANQLRLEGLPLLRLAERRHDCPVLFGHERADFPFALADQPQRHRLHAPGTGTRLHSAPEQRADLVAHQAVQHTARLLRIEEIFVNVTRPADGILHGALGDLVEDGTPRLAQPQHLLERPSDELTLAVWIRGEVHRLRPLARALQLFD